MPPLRPPGVGEPTVPMTRSASAERAFCFRCRGFDLPPVSMPPLLSASVPLPSALVHSCAAHARPSPFISALPVPVCPTLPVPVCPTLSVHIYSCAARRHPFSAARASRSPHCPSPFHLFPVRGLLVGRLRHDGRSLDLSLRGLYIRCGRNRCRNRRRISSPIGEERGAADRRLRGVSFPNGRSFLPETIFLR